MTDQRLEAIAHQAVDVRDNINTQMAALGNVTAWAADSGEVNHENVARIGFLTEFLNKTLVADNLSVFRPPSWTHWHIVKRYVARDAELVERE